MTLPILSFSCFNLYGRKSGFISTLDKGLLCLETHPGKEKTGKGRTECCWGTRRLAVRSPTLFGRMRTCPLARRAEEQGSLEVLCSWHCLQTGSFCVAQRPWKAGCPAEAELLHQHRPCREHGDLSRHRQSSGGCWTQNPECPAKGFLWEWGQWLLLSLQARGRAPGRTLCRRQVLSATFRCLPSAKGLWGHKEPPCCSPCSPCPHIHLWDRQAHSLQATEGTCNSFFFFVTV